MAKQAPVQIDDTELVAKDYVYLGKRVNSKMEPVAAIRLINEDGTLDADEALYKFDRKMNKNVGGVYTGAKFTSNGSSRGLAEARWKRMWDNQEDRIKWSALNDEAESRLRSAKLEKEEGRINDIEQIMLPLRKTYENMRFRHDWAGQEALEKAVLRALRSAPRVIE